MSKLPGLSSDEVLKALRKIGFVYTLLAIIEQAGLTRSEFLKLL